MVNASSLTFKTKDQQLLSMIFFHYPMMNISIQNSHFIDLDPERNIFFYKAE